MTLREQLSVDYEDFMADQRMPLSDWNPWIIELAEGLAWATTTGNGTIFDLIMDDLAISSREAALIKNIVKVMSAENISAAAVIDLLES